MTALCMAVLKRADVASARCFAILYTNLIVIAAMIYLEDGGPVFYTSLRLGKGGKTFRMYKFRSMKVGAPDLRNKDGSTFNADNDPRLTRVGKFIRETSLDETPQLLNVLRGDMSIVGPRPDLPEHLSLYAGDEMRKLEVRPGITGWSQAHFRNALPWKDRIQQDIFYVDHLSFILDLRIIIRTVVSVVRREGIYANECTTEASSRARTL